MLAIWAEILITHITSNIHALPLEKTFYLDPIFNLRNNNSKYDDNDPDNNVIKIIWAMEINRKFWSFSGEVFGRIYPKQLRINGVVYETITMFLIALFSIVDQVFH